MKLSIIIPTKGRKEILDVTLDAAINATRHLEAEIIIVNDSKTDVPVIPDLRHVKLINNPKSGVAAARNFGFRNSSGDVILFLDNDIIISRNSIDHTLKLHADHDQSCFNLNWEYSPETLQKITANPFTRFLKTFQMVSFKGWYSDPTWKDNQLFAAKSIASFHLSISRRDFEKTGGYNEAFPLAGFEDYDFPTRLKGAGIKFYIDSRVTVYHNEIDRLEVDNWLNSQQNRAVTRKKAVNLGYAELALEYGPWKKIVLRAIAMNERLFKAVLHTLPNSTLTDPLYFRMLGALQASRIFQGYTLVD